jgi:hypothetical protein
MRVTTVVVLGALSAACWGSSTATSTSSSQATFEAPEQAVKALGDAVKKGSVEQVLTILGPEGKDLIDTSDPVTARHNRAVFGVALAEGWRLVDENHWKTLVVGNEAWPFPVPLVTDGKRWRFDTAAGKEEVLARRIGRNELAVIRIAKTYVAAQRAYAETSHDGKPAGLYARTFRSDPGKQNGLYWPAERGKPRSPIGDLMTDAADHGKATANASQPTPFHGYYFRILTAQGAAAPGGATDYIVNGEMSRGFALVAWPAHYESTGIMSFIVSHDGIVHEKDLGADTDATAKAMSTYDPDASWAAVAD